jgi:hypothetical protein
MSFVLILLFGVSANAIEFDNCSNFEKRELTVANRDAKESTAWIYQRLEDYLDYDLDRRTIRKIQSSRRVLQCIWNKLDKLVYRCGFVDVWWFARTGWGMGRSVKLRDDFCRATIRRMAAAMVHEASHKCGTTDAAYFHDRKIPPHDIGWIGWQKIASTYEHWIMFNHLCVPDVDC